MMTAKLLDRPQGRLLVLHDGSPPY